MLIILQFILLMRCSIELGLFVPNKKRSEETLTIENIASHTLHGSTVNISSPEQLQHLFLYLICIITALLFLTWIRFVAHFV